MSRQGIRILVVDDSHTFRVVMRDILRNIKGVGEIHDAGNGVEALAQVRSFRPHIVFLDLQMPGLNGIETVKLVKAQSPDTDVVMVSGMSENSAVQTIAAIEAGALDFVCKPKGIESGNTEFLLLQRLRPFVRSAVSRNKCSIAESEITLDKPRPVAPLPSGPVREAPSVPHIDLVVAGVSTGAAGALSRFVSGLTRELDVPMIVVVDVPPVFTRHMVASLAGKSAVPVMEAADREVLLPRSVLVVPGGRRAHLEETGYKTVLRFDDVDGKPGVQTLGPFDHLLFSMAERVWARTLAVVMTGIGNDGTAGVQRLKETPGNYCIVQSADTCVADEMPEAVCRQGCADEVVRLEDLGRRVCEIVGI